MGVKTVSILRDIQQETTSSLSLRILLMAMLPIAIKRGFEISAIIAAREGLSFSGFSAADSGLPKIIIMTAPKAKRRYKICVFVILSLRMHAASTTVTNGAQFITMAQVVRSKYLTAIKLTKIEKLP